MLFGYSKNKGLFVKLMSPFNWFANYFDKSLYDIGLLVLPIFIGILANFVNSEYNKVWVLSAIVACLLLAVLCLRENHIDKERLSSKNKELDSKNKELLEKIEMINGDFRLLNKQSLENHLKVINDEIGFDSVHRISVYFEYSGLFLILGRFSSNPQLAVTRTIQFPLDKGALSKSWEQEYYEDFNCPEFSVKPNAKNNPYYTYQNKHYGFDKEKVDKMNMKSCNYIGFRINDNGMPVGVILFESSKNSLKAKKAKISETCKNYNDVLVRLILMGKKYAYITYDTDILNNRPEDEFLKQRGGNDA